MGYGTCSEGAAYRPLGRRPNKIKRLFYDYFWDYSSYMRLCRRFCICSIVFVLTIFLLPATGYAELMEEKPIEAGINGGIFSGISILTNKGVSYSTKCLPIIGMSLIPYYSTGAIWDLVCEISFHHTFLYYSRYWFACLLFNFL